MKCGDKKRSPTPLFSLLTMPSGNRQGTGRFSQSFHVSHRRLAEMAFVFAVQMRGSLHYASIILLRSTHMEIKRIGTQPSAKGPTDWFTGTVRIDPMFDRTDPARVSGATVTFEPGARTAWHTHPLGQTLIVVAGCGWVQRQGGAVETIHPGDVVLFAPDEKHWHGATATTAMTHIAVQEKLNGKAVDWMEKVSDEQYMPRN
jgi:quercetin dioxygenase-like cupin family protein